jgi:mono/diheme cytochrome c family protein
MKASLIASLALLSAAPAWAAPPSPEAVEFFEKRVRPVLAEHCFSCHGPKKQKASLRLDSEAALLKGGESGKIVIPGDPDKSLLIRAIRHEGDTKMPEKKLSDETIAALTAWVKMGAPWPKSDKVADDADAWKKHWAFQPVKHAAAPAVKDTNWPASPIDFFVLAKLEAKGWKPAPEADRRTLVRRVYFDLLGLPPTPEEVDAFVKDTTTDAYAKLIDKLLASPHFGERWARHWLDVARYADERGYVGVNVDRVYPYAYAYRDWVVRAFNEDMPYDRFVLDQLAADQLVTGADTRDLAAMGFLTVGRRFLNNTHDIIDDRIDLVCRGLMGLTVGCARCHDHKYDPIPLKDYYSLYGIFASSDEPEELPMLLPSPGGPERQAFEAELKKLQDELAKWDQDHAETKKNRPREFREKRKPLENKIKKLKASHAGAPPHGMVMVDRPKPLNPQVFLRGNPNNRGPEVPRQFLEVLAGPERKPFAKGSGRLEMARAIASKDNPLTARVMVNRIWLHLFGAGLVRTPSDFGLRSDPPTHPELLDHLATRFVEDGWSTKKLIRAILLSKTYRQTSDNPQASVAQSVDPDNMLLWKMNRRRLDFEAMRDGMLAVAGRLDPVIGGRSVPLLTPPLSRRRTLYGFIDRQNLPGVYRTFDFASPDTHSPYRFTTTVPQQALFLMNSPFLAEQAKHLASLPQVANGGNAERITQLYRLILVRTPSDAERARTLRFIRETSADKGGAKGFNAWEQYAQVLLLSNEFAFVD